MAFDRTKFLQRFADEAKENLDNISQGLLHLEQNPQDQDNLHEIFRAAHTLKGSSRMMKLTVISDTAHKVEDVLSALRDGMSLTPTLLNLLFRAIDTLRTMVVMSQTMQENIALDQALCDALEVAATGKSVVQSLPDLVQPAEAETVHKIIQVIEQPCIQIAEPMISSSELPPVQPLPEVETIQAPTTTTPEEKAVTIRIHAKRLDEIIQTIGEVISFQNRLKQRMHEIKQTKILSDQILRQLEAIEWHENSQNNPQHPILKSALNLNDHFGRWIASFRDDIDLLGILFDDLQAEALGLRMLPLATLFDTFPRLVRDLAMAVDKQVKLTMQGGDTNLDKVIIEKIGSPLMHMIRNAVDHGIETPEERLKANKPETGTIRLTARAEGEGIMIELSDDGGGIPIDKLKNKALQKKLIAAADLESISRSELFNMIFLPGLSTSPIITDHSGRGVGMDVVKQGILDELKGTIKIDSEPGHGTTFRIRLPLTLATIHVLLVRVGERIFALPKNGVREILKVPSENLIKVVGRQAIRLREQVLPVVGLANLLRIQTPFPSRESHLLTLLIIFSGGEYLGLMVDYLLDEIESVLKPLPYFMRSNSFISGILISGLNEIVGVINVASIIKIAKDFKEGGAIQDKGGSLLAKKHILVVDDSLNTREIEKEILQSYGYKVSVAQNGVEALEQTNKQQFDLIVTDVEMPRMDGFTLTEKLRETENYRYTPIIIVTSRDKEEDKQRGILVGADAYIVKGSFDQSNLLDTVRNLSGA